MPQLHKHLYRYLQHLEHPPMIKKIARRTALSQFSRLPTSNRRRQIFYYPEGYEHYYLTLNSKTTKSHINLLPKELVSLLEKMHIDAVVYLGDTRTPWLYQENDYTPIKEAKQYLRALGASESFNGAFLVNISELETFARHILWLQRCNAALPDFHFVDTAQRIVCHPCKDWNFHFSTLDEEIDLLFRAAVQGTELLTINSCIPSWNHKS